MGQCTVVLSPDSERGGYSVTVPALPGCISEGDTYEQALFMAQDAIRLYIESLVAHGEPVPDDVSEQPRVEHVRVV